MASIELGTRPGRLVIAAAVLGSGMALLDGTVVNVALVRIGDELDASLADLQWITNGYLLALASLILLGGSLGDRFGRRRIFVTGVIWFAVASLACGIAQTSEQLIAARVLQGVGGALLTPGSLSIIQSVFRSEDRAKAIGAWSGLGGISAAIGPFVGGWLVEYASWRWAFLLNLPLAAVTVWIALTAVPETLDESAPREFDIVGAILATASLAVLTYALIQLEALGAGRALALVGASLAAGVGFAAVELRSAHPMVQPSLFRSRQFTAANLMTMLVYAALGAVFFFLTLQLQTVLGYGPLLAGLASLPVTVLMLFLAAKGGEVGARIGPRLPMTVGPIVCAAGAALLTGVGAGDAYWSAIFPGISIFGLGLCILVAPLTATVLAAAPDRWAGIASGVNNAVARAGSLLAVAALPAVVGLSGADYQSPVAFDAGYGRAMWICTVLLAGGGVVSWLLIRNPEPAALPPSSVPGALQPSAEATSRTERAQRHTAPAGWSCAGSEGGPGTAVGSPTSAATPDVLPTPDH
ncbi:MFS transporter [Intrasporangium sp.]|uniref:MFS transporter n=1 Tax=Intrasporangium sp. TaxID=1925024 RepID=UPI00293A425F|nr:MFS transporter [Intrasporangium sp.]MDV3220712.1 DHA2 family efflux MFS transporter permease subunit [Intrasporangium sp.]